MPIEALEISSRGRTGMIRNGCDIGRFIWLCFRNDADAPSLEDRAAHPGVIGAEAGVLLALHRPGLGRAPDGLPVLLAEPHGADGAIHVVQHGAPGSGRRRRRG